MKGVGFVVVELELIWCSVSFFVEENVFCLHNDRKSPFGRPDFHSVKLIETVVLTRFSLRKNN